MDDLLAWDDLKRELIAVLAGVLYLAAVRLIQRYKGMLDTWLSPVEPPAGPSESARPDKETDETADAEKWLSQLKEPPAESDPPTR